MKRLRWQWWAILALGLQPTSIAVPAKRNSLSQTNCNWPGEENTHVPEPVTTGEGQSSTFICEAWVMCQPWHQGMESAQLNWEQQAPLFSTSLWAGPRKTTQSLTLDIIAYGVRVFPHLQFSVNAPGLKGTEEQIITSEKQSELQVINYQVLNFPQTNTNAPF